MYYAAIISTVLVAVYGILYSLLAYNSFYRNRFIELITEKDTRKGMKDTIQGRRIYVPRTHLRDVRVNLYLPHSNNPPVMYFAHGGDFIHGDPDDVDQFLDRMKDIWDVAIVSVGYSLVREHVTSYPQDEIENTVAYFYEHGCQYGFDGKRFILAGSQAGAYLSMIAGVSAAQKGMIARGFVFLYPFIDYVSSSLARAGYHPGPVALVAAGDEKKIFACEEYEFELDRAGIGARLKTFPDEKECFLEEGGAGAENCSRWIRERIDDFLRR